MLHEYCRQFDMLSLTVHVFTKYVTLHTYAMKPENRQGVPLVSVTCHIPSTTPDKRNFLGGGQGVAEPSALGLGRRCTAQCVSKKTSTHACYQLWQCGCKNSARTMSHGASVGLHRRVRVAESIRPSTCTAFQDFAFHTATLILLQKCMVVWFHPLVATS